MRVLHVITDTDRRGAQTFALDLASAMSAMGHEVETVALAPGSQERPLLVDVLGASPRGLATIRQLRRRMGSADITIAHGSSTLLACALTGRPFVYRQISDSRFWASSMFRRLRVAIYLRRARTIVALSAAAREALVEHLWVPANRLHVVPNGVPVGNFHEPTAAERAEARATLGLPIEGFVALYIGALVPEKGVATAINAFRSMPSVSLVIAGDGPDRARLEALPAGDNVRFLGATDQPMHIYAAADVVLLPSIGGDSMPATLIEAGFCALPAIATPVGSIEEIVLHGKTGLIVPAGDVPALTTAIHRLAADPDLAARLGATARAHCNSSFEIGVVAESWLRSLGP